MGDSNAPCKIPPSGSQQTGPAQQLNPHALDSAQDPTERFEVMQPPPSSTSFDPYHDLPISTNSYATRAHVHQNGIWHCSVHIWIVNPSSSTVLLQKRSMTKDTFPGRLDISSAGHVEAGKSLVKTAQLELAEELGVDDVEESELKLSFVIPAEQYSVGGCNAYEHVYFLTRREDGDTTTQFALGTAEVSAVCWMPAKELLHALRMKDDGYAIRTTRYVDFMEKELVKILGDECLK